MKNEEIDSSQTDPSQTDSSFNEMSEECDYSEEEGEEYLFENQGQISWSKYNAEEDIEMNYLYEVENLGFQNFGLNNLSTPLDYFLFLFSNELIDKIIHYTNSNAAKKINNEKQIKQKKKKWKDIGKRIFLAF